MTAMAAQRAKELPEGVIDLTFLTEEEEFAIRVVLEEDLKLQQAEEARLKRLREDIKQDSKSSVTGTPGSVCARCGESFGWMFNTGALCPTCSERVCKRHRAYKTYSRYPWVCTLCEKRMRLQTNQEVFSRCAGPSNVLRVSFRERKDRLEKQKKFEKERQEKLRLIQERKEQLKKELKLQQTGLKTSLSVPVTILTDELDGPEDSLTRSSPVISGGNLKRSSPVITKRPSGNLSSSSEQLGYVITAAKSSSPMQNSDPVIAPYPPGVMAKTNKATKQVQGKLYLKVYVKQNKRLVLHVDKATGLAAANNDNTSDPYALIYILPDHRQLTKKKTRVALRTCDPEWDMYWESPLPGKSDFSGQILWVSIWHWNRFSKAEFLGEVMLPLWQMNLNNKSTKSYPLQPEQSVIQSAGELRMSLRYEPSEDDDEEEDAKKKRKHPNGKLHVHILEAKNLFYDHSFVKCLLRPGKQKAHHPQQTHIITQPKCPVYDEQMVFEKVSAETLSTAHALEVSVWDAHFNAYPMGVVRLGPQPTPDSKPWMDSQDAEVSHWEAMLSNPNQWVEQWQLLRPDGDCRDVTKSYTLTRSCDDILSPQHSDGDKEEQFSSSMPIVHPSSDNHVQMINSLSTTESISSSVPKPDTATTVATSNNDQPAEEPQPPIVNQLSTEDKVTAENRELNRGDTTDSNTLFTTSTDSNKKHVSHENEWSYEDPRPRTTSNASSHATYSDAQSVYSGSMMYTHDDITGQIQMSVSYSDTDNTLRVSINKVRGLTPPNKIDENHTNPYVKTYLLPDRSKSTKKKTAVKKGVDPIFNETIKYPIKHQELSKHTLKVGVWHNDFWRHNLFLGEITLPLDKVNWSNPSDKWYELEEPSYDSCGQSTDRGQLKVALQFNITTESKQKGNLVVTIISGHRLLQDEKTINPVVKCHLLPDQKKKFKTKVLKDNHNPSWQERFVFEHLILDDLRHNRVLEVTVWDAHKHTKHYDFIGGLRLGPRPERGSSQLHYMDSSEAEMSHWMTVVDTPGDRVMQLHTLRHTMSPQQVTTTQTSQDELDWVTTNTVGVTSQQEVTSPQDVTLQQEVMTQQEVVTPQVTVEQEVPLQLTPSPPPEIAVTTELPSPVRSERMRFDSQEDSPLHGTPQHGTPKMQMLKVSNSMDSICSTGSVYSQAGGGKVQYDITGSICLAVYHTNNQLVVDVKCAKEIVGVNHNHLSNPYVKLYLLPDTTKDTKKKTHTVRKSVNPEFNETFTYNGSTRAMESRILQVSMWSQDRFGHNKFLGEVRFHLKDISLSDTTYYWYPLQEMIDEDFPSYVGDLKVMLQFAPSQDKKAQKKGKGCLNVWIQQARELPEDHSSATFVQCVLLPRNKSERHKSNVIRDTTNPNYNAKFQFDKVTDVELSYDRVLEITIWEPHRNTNEFVGGIRLGPKPQSGSKNEWMDSYGTEVSQWEMMMARPEEWADEWHPLRSSMKAREVLY